MRRAAPVALLLAASAVALPACGSRVKSPPAASASAGASAAPSGRSGSAGAGNTASDQGVTSDTVKIGVIVGKTSPLGPDTFSASLYGAQAYFDALNAKGGIHGRKVVLDVCDDGGSGDGNVRCARKLATTDKVFALAGVTAFSYQGAPLLDQKEVPDIGGQPVDNAYDRYSHLYTLYGSDEPRNGDAIGWDGKLSGGTEVYRWFKLNLGTRTAAVISYNVAPSQRFANSIAAGLRAEGYKVVTEQVDLGLSNFDAAVVDMKSQGVDSIYDALDDSGNARLCSAMDSAGLRVKAKITTTQGWTDAVKSAYRNSPACRNSLYATGNTRNYDDTQYPAVAAFRQAMATYEKSAPPMSMWQLEGYASAQWLTDAATSCGAKLTRPCVEAYMYSQKAYNGHGLLTPRTFVKMPTPPPTKYDCLNVARWQDSANGGQGGWVTQVKDMDTTCYTVPQLTYSAT